MAEPTETSADKLDELLREGKISRDEYQNLHAALAAGPLPATGPSSGPSEATDHTERPRLCKSRKDRILGGVCAGIAEHFNVDPWIVRIVFIAGLIVAAGAAIPLYGILYFTLPWSTLEEPRKCEAGVVPWRFALTVAVAWTFLEFVVYNVVFIHLVFVYGARGVMPPKMSMVAADFMRPFIGYPMGSLLRILLFCAVVGCYWITPRGSAIRRTYVWLLAAAYLSLVVAYFVLPALLVPAGEPVFGIR